MFRFLGRLTVTYPGVIFLSWIALGIALQVFGPPAKNTIQDDDIRFLPPGTPSLRAHQLLEAAFPVDVCASNVLFAVERPNEALSPADFVLVDHLIARLEKLQKEEPALQINTIGSRKTPLIGNRLTSADGHCTLLQVALATP